jgi:PhzF family phenazine biosynthesis protein
VTTLPFFQVDAFADRPLAGNPAAVIPLDRWLDEPLMQAIAAENNLSETAFTVPSDSSEADYELRWFTPATEVPLCGHATLASAHVLIRGEEIRFFTRSGLLKVSRDAGLLWLDLPAAFVEPREFPGLDKALGISGETYCATGEESIAIMALEDERAVRSVTPDFAALSGFPDLVIVTAPGDEQDIASRVFAVPVGINEDPVTGAAHAALVPFWAKRLGRHVFSAVQASRRGGILHCRQAGGRVILGGSCVTVITGSFQL